MESPVDKYCNTKIKFFSDDLIRLTISKNPIFHEEKSDIFKGKSHKSKPKEADSETRSDSLKRAKDKVFEIAYSNHWDYFITLTLNGQVVDRYETGAIGIKLKLWLNNMQKRYGMSYILVPELHADGAVHFHGLARGNLRMVDSGKVFRGKKIYNFDNWSLGFSTAMQLDGNVEAISKYMVKYIAKGNSMIMDRFYFSSRDLVREVPTYYAHYDYDKVAADEVYILGANNYVKYKQYNTDAFVHDFGKNVLPVNLDY